MNTDKSTPATTSTSIIQSEKEVANKELMTKLLELEKKLEIIEKKLLTPLIN